MPILRGEDVIVGVGVENARGTAVAPQQYIPARTPSGIKPVIDKVPIRETRGTKIPSTGSEAVMKRAEGDVEFTLRAQTIGYLLKSLLGDLDTAAVIGQSGVKDHTFTVLAQDPEHPSLTLALSQPNIQDYKYALAVVASLKLELVPDDLVKATAEFIAASEAEQSSPYTPAFDDGDVYFRHQDVTIKIAANVAGLGAAQATKVKSFELEIPNGARVDQNVSELNPGNVLATAIAPKGKFKLDLQNTDLHDVFDGGTYKAVQVTLTRTDVTIGSSAHPTITITLPKVSFENWTPDRPIDDVVREEIEFLAHYDDDEAKAIEVVVRNTVTDYDPES